MIIDYFYFIRERKDRPAKVRGTHQESSKVEVALSRVSIVTGVKHRNSSRQRTGKRRPHNRLEHEELRLLQKDLLATDTLM